MLQILRHTCFCLPVGAGHKRGNSPVTRLKSRTQKTPRSISAPLAKPLYSGNLDPRALALDQAVDIQAASAATTTEDPQDRDAGE